MNSFTSTQSNDLRHIFQGQNKVHQKKVYAFLWHPNSFSEGDVILRQWSHHCLTTGHVIFRNKQVPYALSQHRDRANVTNVSSEWVNDLAKNKNIWIFSMLYPPDSPTQYQ